MNMKRKSPISIDYLRFYTYNTDEKDDLVFIDQFPFDDRHDFLVDEFFSGIAVRIDLSNDCNGKGVRRCVTLSLVDATIRCVVSSRTVKVNMSKDEFFKDYYVCFPADEADLKPGHTYKMVTADDTASQTLGESIFHLFDGKRLGHPSEWYEVCDGGVRPAWKDELYKTIRTIDTHDYYVRFNLGQKFGYMLPNVLPELEMRLYYPGGQHVAIRFREPMRSEPENCKDGGWFVEYPFATVGESNGVFYAELLCMEYPIAGFVFDSNGPDERGKWFGRDIEPFEEYTPEAACERMSGSSACCGITDPADDADDFDELLDRFIEAQMSESDSDQEADSPDQDDEEPRSGTQQSDHQHDEPLLASLDGLTGLRVVKEKLTIYERVVRFNKMRSDRGLPTSVTPLHAMFLGSPGTGKTTVAKMMGMMLRRAGVLSSGHVVVRERSTLLGQNYNSESEKTLAAIEEAQGGILLIDEAYQLYQPNDSRDPGKFVIETLLTALANESNRDWMLILAGYPDEMRRMFEMNPGLKSRIPDSNIYVFDDFSEDELMEIAEKYLSRQQYRLSADAHMALAERLKVDYSRRERTFGNARHVINMIQTEILPAMAVRVTGCMEISDSSLTEIQAADIPAVMDMPQRTARPRVGFAV